MLEKINTTTVMGPLFIQNWNHNDFILFNSQLIALKSIGIDAISTDIWWSDVNYTRDKYDFTKNNGGADYQKLAEIIICADLKWTPILSTHSARTNSIGIPGWILDIKGDECNMWYLDETQYKSKHPVHCKDILSPWFYGNRLTENKGTVELYTDFFKAFSDKFGKENYFMHNGHQVSYWNNIDTIYLSCGSSGELRYPFDAVIGYPYRGYIMAYSDAAIKNFQCFIKNKYTNNLNKLNDAWKSSLYDFEEISPPTNIDVFNPNYDTFFNGGGLNCQYAHDFLFWYQDVLIYFFNEISTKARTILGDFKNFPDIPISAKIAGMGWFYWDTLRPHAAELCSGYYNIEKNIYGYHNYLDILNSFKNNSIDCTFTAVDKEDYQDGFHSAGKTLSIQFINECNDLGIKLRGENAIDARSLNSRNYILMSEIVSKYNLVGITIMRYNDLFYPNSHVFNHNGIMFIKYFQYLNK